MNLAPSLRMHPPISDYGLIGDCETAALVATNGSIDWLCWPRFDSAACFAALLGRPEHGHWSLRPSAEVKNVRRRYRGDTLVLETVLQTVDAEVALIDFMPVRRDETQPSQLIRIVEGRRGRCRMEMELVIRFDYGRIVPWLGRTGDGRKRAVAGPHAATLQTPVETRGEDNKTLATFDVRDGERVPFTLTYAPSHHSLPERVEPDKALDATEAHWADWASRSRYRGPWADAVTRSLITIKALTYEPTGGIVAAPTTSLPEEIGGERNWDYRFCWLRDATFTLLSLINAGYRHEAEAWSDWLLRAVAGSATQIQPLYGVAGEHRNDEHELPWLPGYRDSTPVRTGNAAYDQLQLDVFGSVMDTLHESARFGLDLREASAGLQRELMRRLEEVWRLPDEGLWEVRGEPRHFVHSKLLCWVAFDRAVSSAERFGLQGPVERWRRLREEIRAEILERGFDERIGAFVQAYDAEHLDAAVLLIPIVGFLPADDPRVVSTTQVIERELSEDGLLHRYRTEAGVDGLSGGEGAFLACSFWLVDNMILQGRHEDARRLFERLLSLRNDVGLLAEEYDVKGKELVGNFPQAFSHFALIDAAFNYAGLRGVAVEEGAGASGERDG
jgi:GH15 family glucan-1,4-alpha-glucosidase